ncbi:MAG: prepilin-type N-terminal cleavage/methylation domain-containing protein [Pirellulales bacterium]|nr:prepilin-type N-terminal cleavage/methylation domain-containing protein [Pirellulales bacterium]
MKRRGFTVLEMMVAAALLAVAATLCLQMVMLDTATRRAAAQRRLATREAANLVERLMARPRDQLTRETAEALELSPEAVEKLPEARLAVEFDESADDGPSATRLTLTLTWQGRSGQTVRPVRLVAWHYGPKEATP